MSAEKRSKRHHYLPRHYLRGFTNSADCFYVYDKQKDRILPKPLSPESMFFENNLNTIVLPLREQSDFLEGLYTHVENNAWASFDNVRQSTPDQAVTLWDKMNLFLFLLVLHWRLPSNSHHADGLSNDLFADKCELPFFKMTDELGRNAPAEVLADIRSNPGWSKVTKLVAPFAPFYERNWSHRLEEWRFFYSGDNLNWFLVGDNPIVTRGYNDSDPNRCLDEFIFPVSGRIVLATNSSASQKLRPEFVIQLGSAIIMRSMRFAACHRIDFLEAIVDDYRLHRKFKAEDSIINSLFGMLSE